VAFINIIRSLNDGADGCLIARHATLMEADSANGKPERSAARTGPTYILGGMVIRSAEGRPHRHRDGAHQVVNQGQSDSARVSRLMVRNQAARGLTSLSIRRRKVRSAMSKS